jgi:hypothetical protein
MNAASLAVLLSFAGLAAGVAGAQAGQPEAKAPPAAAFVWPERMANARVLPPETGGERLRQTMVGFARSLGVRCTFCHVGPEGAPLTELDFASDANPHKEIARGMMRMVGRLNREELPVIAGLSEPRVTCYTCHRGATEPAVALPSPAPPPPGERGAP